MSRNKGEVYIPSKQQIREACKQIQSNWTDKERNQHQVSTEGFKDRIKPALMVTVVSNEFYLGE